MNFLSINSPVLAYCDHHPYIDHRFVVKRNIAEQFFEVLKQSIHIPIEVDRVVVDVLDVGLPQIVGEATLEEFCFSNFWTPEAAIVCLWIDCPVNLSRETDELAARFFMIKGYQYASWWEKEKNCTRISIWMSVPEAVVMELQRLEADWEEQREKGVTL